MNTGLMIELCIETPNLLIRNLNQNDLAAFHEYRWNPDIAKYQGFEVMDLEQVADFIRQQENKLSIAFGEWKQYGIENRKTNKLVGDCALKVYDNGSTAEIGITISPLVQNKGYAKEAMEAIVQFLFGKKKVNLIEVIVDADNFKAIRLVESLGFKKENHQTEKVFFKGNWGIEFHYKLEK